MTSDEADADALKELETYSNKCGGGITFDAFLATIATRRVEVLESAIRLALLRCPCGGIPCPVCADLRRDLEST